MLEHVEIMDPDLGLQWAFHNKARKTSDGEKLIHKNRGWLKWWSLVLMQWKTLCNHKK